MNSQSSSLPDYPLLRLLLVDEDAIFRSGLRFWLEQFPDVQVVAAVAEGTAAFQVLADQPESRTVPLDLVILDLELGQGDRPQSLELCQQIKTEFPRLSVLFLSRFAEPVVLAAAQRAGADGYCPKTLEVEDLGRIIRQVAAGQQVWIKPQPLDLASPASSSSVSSASGSLPPFVNAIRQQWRNSGLRQIETALAEIHAQIQRLDLTDLDRAVLLGRQRELRVARRLVNWLLPPAVDQTPPHRNPTPRSAAAPSLSSAAPRSPLSPAPAASLSPLPSTPPSSLTATAPPQAVLFDAILVKLQANLDNGTDLPLEIDILRENKKRELFYLILRKLEEGIEELRYSEVAPDQIAAMRSSFLLDIWQAVAIDFLGKYYTVVADSGIGNVEVVVVEAMLRDAPIVQRAILDTIPGIVDLIKHLLFQVPLLVDDVPYPPGNPAALARAELLLDNALIQIANAVMQPLLNQFSMVEAIKQNFYNRRLLSNREIERFRNDLSWRYRMDQYVREPKDIFESQYSLFIFSGRGIQKTRIYAPRTQELEQLSGIPYAVTLALETRDAVAPRVRTVVSLVGNSLVYVLTEVIGRGIGLIGRGVVKGIGNVWQDSRFDRR